MLVSPLRKMTRRETEKRKCLWSVTFFFDRSIENVL